LAGERHSDSMGRAGGRFAVRWRFLCSVALATVGCGGSAEDGAGHRSTYERPELDPSRPLPREFRRVRYSLTYEDQRWSEDGLAFHAGPMSVALSLRDRSPLGFRAWCADVHHYIDEHTVYSGQLYSSYEVLPTQSGVEHPENLDAVNYLINAYPAGSTFTPDGAAAAEVADEDLQAAVWTLVSSGLIGYLEPLYRSDLIDALVADALRSGEGFVPGPGDRALLIVVNDGSVDRRSGNEVQTLALAATVPGTPTFSEETPPGEDSNPDVPR